LVFTSGDRVLLHLLLKGSRADPTSGVADQDDIAAYCGIGRTHVPRALKPLINDDLVNESQGRAPGRTRRVKVYNLTEKGCLAAMVLRNKANETVMEWIDETGTSHSEHCVDALRRINDHLGSRGLSQIPISLFLTIGREKVGWNDILFLSSSVRGETTETICIPEGWIPISSPKVPEVFLDRQKDMKRLQDLVDGSSLLALTGEAGIGKRTLVAAWAERNKRKILWLDRGEGSEFCIDADRYDLLVMIGAPMVDVTSTLVRGDGIDLSDPRNEDWPELLRPIPLLGIMDGYLGSSGEGIIDLKGLDEGTFVREAIGSGLPEKLAIPFFKASKGSPMALSYLGELEDSTLGGLGTLDEEAAIMSLILGLRSKL